MLHPCNLLMRLKSQFLFILIGLGEYGSNVPWNSVHPRLPLTELNCASEVPFGGQNRGVPQYKLALFNFDPSLSHKFC